MGITLTDAAAERVRSFLTEQTDAVGLRLGVTRTGCSGWAYVVDIAKQVGAKDTVFESHGIQVLVDAESLALVDGTEIDFGGDNLGKSFRFHNPNVKSECGCGESFAV